MATARNLEIVADDERRDGHVTFGVLYDGAFVPLSEVKSGHLPALAGNPTSQQFAEPDDTSDEGDDTPKKK